MNNIEQINEHWELVCPVVGNWIPTRILKYKSKNLIGGYIYKIQKKYWILGWIDIATFNSGNNVH